MGSKHRLVRVLRSAGRPGRTRRPPAGRRGFRLPRRLTAEETRLYAKVVNLPWRPAYASFGWNGGHLRVTAAKFIATVIAPRLRSKEPFPLDRPLAVITERPRSAAQPAPANTEPPDE